MKYAVIFLSILFSMCNNKQSSESFFEGSFKGRHAGNSTTAGLTVDGNQLKGKVILQGKAAIVSGRIQNNKAKGVMEDVETGQTYDFTGTIEGNRLRFTLTDPGNSDHQVELVMYRESEEPYPSRRENISKNNTQTDRELNEDLVGTWKFTEILGGGDMSYTTEYFMELRDNGTMRSWTGRSIGMERSRESEEAKAARGEWYDDGNKLYFIDPNTKEKDYTLFTVKENTLILHNGASERKLFERVR